MLIHIFLSIILPIFVIIGIGVLMDRRFHLDLPTLSKLNFYVFVPALSFIKLLQADLTGGMMVSVGLFSLAHMAVLFLLSWLLFALPAFRRQQTVLAMGAVFYNAGNYGIPLILLAFGGEQIGVIAVVIVVQNLLSFTLGIWLLERQARGAKSVLRGMVQVPIIYAVTAALLLRATNVPLPAQVLTPLNYLADGLIPIALLTLGVQLARTRLTHNFPALSAVTTIRLVVSPLLAALLIIPFSFAAKVSSVLIVAAGFPVAVNLYILAAEYRQDETLAAQSIFISTLLSGLTVSILLVMFR